MTSTTSISSSIPAFSLLHGASIQEHIAGLTDELLASFPNPEQLSAEQRRGLIARYTAVLEGNFIYWMTGALLAVRSEEARAIIVENLHEEVRDCHPGMMRRFALAAHAVPTDSDAAAVYKDLTKVRLFVGRLQAVQLVLMMAFFEGLLQRFMPYLAELAGLQGSQEREYTDVHGVCDIAHTEGLYRALEAESLLCPLEPGANAFEGVELLGALLQNIVFGQPADLRLAE